MKATAWIPILLLTGPLCSAQIFESADEPENLMPAGVYYYPEQWEPNQWERDIRRIASLGFRFTHMAEFSWSRLEPEDGVFDFDWLDECLALAAKYGLKVILCTPSPTPPAWLTEAHPEILVVTEEGYTVRHGMRLNCNGSHPVYQQYIGRIVRMMAERYGHHPAVCGWQLDNEPHFEGLYDHSDFAKTGFQEYLKQKYGTIEALNKAWGGAFWSFAYNRFEQIDIPNRNERSANPHAYIDFKRYNARALKEALRFQEEQLRGIIGPSQWITTNHAYYEFLPSVDPFCGRDFLDFASHTMYPLNTFLAYGKAPSEYRTGSGLELAFSAEMARSVTGMTGIMELQPGQINWGRWNSQPLPGAVRMWIWHCFGLGDRFVCTYRFRQPLYGSEQFHKGIMEPDGVTLSPGGHEFVQAIHETAGLERHDRPVPEDVASRATAFLWKHDNLFSLEHTQVREDWDSWAYLYAYYGALKSLGVPVTFVTEDDSFDPNRHPFMVVAACEMADRQLIRKWTEYVQAGGHLILTLRSGMKDGDSHLWETLQQEPLWELTGTKMCGFDQLPRTDTARVEVLGKAYGWNLWGDWLAPMEGTETWGRYADQFYAGTPCVTYRRLGKGSVCYIGVASDGNQMERAVLQNFYQREGVRTLDLPENVFVEYRDGYHVGVNYSSSTVIFPIPEGARIWFGSRETIPAGVTVWSD